jgi:hypothetical protein
MGAASMEDAAWEVSASVIGVTLHRRWRLERSRAEKDRFRRAIREVESIVVKVTNPDARWILQTRITSSRKHNTVLLGIAL